MGEELGEDFNLDFALSCGLLPFVQSEPEAAYVNTYLKEKLNAEGLIGNMPPFVRFLAVAGRSTDWSSTVRTSPAKPQLPAARWKRILLSSQIPWSDTSSPLATWSESP